MITIELKIKEKRRNKNASFIKVEETEKGLFATEDEKKISKILQNRLKLKDKVNIIDEDDTDVIDKIIKELLKD